MHLRRPYARAGGDWYAQGQAHKNLYKGLISDRNAYYWIGANWLYDRDYVRLTPLYTERPLMWNGGVFEAYLSSDQSYFRRWNRR